jgi:hypothetical protein
MCHQLKDYFNRTHPRAIEVTEEMSASICVGQRLIKTIFLNDSFQVGIAVINHSIDLPCHGI